MSKALVFMLLIQGPVSLKVEEQASGKLVLLFLAGWPLAICFSGSGNPTFVEMTVRGLYVTGDSAVLRKILS